MKSSHGLDYITEEFGAQILIEFFFSWRQVLLLFSHSWTVDKIAIYERK